jgi:hypothetical protein
MLTSFAVAGIVLIASSIACAFIGYVLSREDTGSGDPMQQANGDAPHMDLDNWK